MTQPSNKDMASPIMNHKVTEKFTQRYTHCEQQLGSMSVTEHAVKNKAVDITVIKKKHVKKGKVLGEG